jgi:putative peptidoglycan lipid II flippase
MDKLAALAGAAGAVLLAPLAVLLAGVRVLVGRPSLVVALTIVLDCVPPGRDDVAAAQVTPADLSVAALVAVVAVRALIGEEPLFRRGWLPFAMASAALAVATIASQDPTASVVGFARFAELFVLLPIAVAAAVRDRRDFAIVCAAALGVSVVEGAIGVHQFLTGTGASYGMQDIRAIGTFSALDVMSMATVVGLGIVVTLALGLSLRGPRRAALVATAALLMVPLAFSLSRGAWLATAWAVAATTVAAGWRLAVRGAVFAAALAVVLFGGFGLGSATLAARVQAIGTQDQSVNDRFGLWETAVAMWADYPATGVGPKNFAAFRDNYATLSVSSGSDVADATLGFQREPLLSPHSLYLLILSEQGVIGFAAFGILFLAFVVWAMRPRPPNCHAATGESRWEYRFLDLAAPGIVVWTFVDFLYADIGGPSSIFEALLLGLVVRRALVVAPPRWPKPPRRRWLAGARGRIASSGPIARAALVSAVLSVLGTLLGLGRDLLLAAFFGATGDTDAFLVAWTVPETAAPLLIEGAMAFLMVPVFSRAIERGEGARSVVAGTLAKTTLVLAVLAGVTLLAAPVLVGVLAPGLADPGLAVTSTRVVSITVLMFGLAGYLSAALRASHVFAAPAAIYLAYNLGIITVIVALRHQLGIVSAALGVAVGSVLMVAMQLPTYLRHVGLPSRLSLRGSVVTLGAFLPIAVFTLTRQAQVFVERFFGSSLEPGTISQLNYAQKVAQVPMVLVLVLTVVTFPALARSIAAGDRDQARRRIETDLRAASTLILLAVAYLVAFAPVVVEVLFQRGEFTAADTAGTAAILRVYVLGLLGHTVVGVLARPFFSGARPTWYPAAAIGVGLLTTAVIAGAATGPWGAIGIAAGNAVGITVTAGLLLAGLGRRVVDLPLGPLGTAVARLAAAAAGGAAAGWLAAHVLSPLPPLVLAVAGGLVVTGVFLAIALLIASPDVERSTKIAVGRLGRG